MARRFRCGLAETGSFVCRCLNSLTMPRFHTPAYVLLPCCSFGIFAQLNAFVFKLGDNPINYLAQPVSTRG